MKTYISAAIAASMIVSTPVFAEKALPILPSALSNNMVEVQQPVPMNNSGLPVVPVDIMDKTVTPLESNIIESTIKENNADLSMAKKQGEVPDLVRKDVLVMKPGVNQIIPIAINHPNRIVSPFANPEVTTTSLTMGDGKGSCGEVCIKDNVIYIATNKPGLVTMYVTEAGSQNTALSVTMVPKRIPPREVRMVMKDDQGQGVFARNKKAEKWEKSSDYVETIKKAFKKIALGSLPTGYTLHQLSTNGSIPTPACEQYGFHYDFSRAQVMMGYRLNIIVGVVTNTSNKVLAVNEIACGGWDIAAVAVYPSPVLNPGESSEIYIANKQSGSAKTRSPVFIRPSLLN